MSTVGDIVRWNARRYPNKLGIVFEDIRLTWKEVNTRVNKLAHALIDRGMNKGDKVAILKMNSNYYLELIFGLAKTGLLSVPLNYRLSEKELIYIINDSEAKVLVVSQDFFNVVGKIKEQLKGIQRFIGIGKNIPDYMETYEEMIKDYPEEEPDIEVGEEDLFNLIYTSGTTGLPKGVIRDHRSVEVNTFHLLLADREASSQDIILTCFPFSSLGTYGFDLGFSYIGCTQVILKRFDPLSFLQIVEKERITSTVLAPTMINMILSHPDFDKYDLTSLRAIAYGASPMPPELLRKALKLLSCRFFQLYGSTETFWGTSLSPEDHVLEGDEKQQKRLNSAGKELGSTEVKIVDKE